MRNEQKKKIGIWFGGCSTEYEISLQSAEAVIRHMDREAYDPVLIGIDRKGNWFLYEGDTAKIPADTWHTEKCSPAVLSTDRSVHGLLVFRQGGKKIDTISLDGAFPVLHGKNGEDGTVQGAVELAGIPLIGCNTLASAVCMDKDMAHRLVQAAGIKVPRAYVFTREQAMEILQNGNRLEEKMKELGYPVFVKPVRAGSSFGITKVTSGGQLEEAVRLALEHDSTCMIEEAIPGFEVGCAVMGIDHLSVGEVDEIELSDGFFDYTEKYTLKTSGIHVPARITKQKADQIRETAKIIYKALGCSHFARVDMFLTPEGEICFNEVNTIPGFTSHSRYPNMMKAAGISFEELVDKLITMGLTARDGKEKYVKACISAAAVS